MKMASSQRLAGVAQWQSRSFPSSSHPQISAALAVNRPKKRAFHLNDLRSARQPICTFTSVAVARQGQDPQGLEAKPGRTAAASGDAIPKGLSDNDLVGGV